MQTNTPAAILYHATGSDPGAKVRAAAEYYRAAYGTAPNLAAIPRGWPIPQVDGLRVAAADLPGPNFVLVGVAEGEQL